MSAPIPPPMKSMRRSPTSVQRRLFRQQRLWRQLTAYRPLIVLGGIWLGLLAIAFLAFGQLTHNAPDQPTAAEPARPYPHERRDGASAPPATAPPISQAPDRIAPATPSDPEAQTVNGLSIWTIAALVTSCAGGCWLLAILINMPRRPKKRRAPRSNAAKSRNRYRLQPSQQPPVSASPATQPATSVASDTVPKLETYNPDQPLVAPAPSAQPASAPPATAVRAASEVTVVAEETQHQLDWPSDSLVNTADVRQRRSLSSFM